MATRVRCLLIVFLFLKMAFAGPRICGQCQPSAPMVKALQAIPTQTVGANVRETEGLAYLDIRCLDEAQAAFEQEIAESANSAPDKRESQRALGTLLLDLTKAFVDWKDGDLKTAKATFLRFSDEAMPTIVNTRAIFALSELLLQFPDPATWQKLEPKLKILDEQRNLWTARRYRLLYGITAENAPDRIEFLEKLLEQELSTRERIENQVILATLLRKAGRLTEARLLTAYIESSVGDEAIAPDLRATYVRECAAIASEQARQGDQQAAARYTAYLVALGEMYDPH
jgi:hypothetical protein